MAEGSSPDDEKLFLGSLRASRAIKNGNFKTREFSPLIERFLAGVADLFELKYKFKNSPAHAANNQGQSLGKPNNVSFLSFPADFILCNCSN